MIEVATLNRALPGEAYCGDQAAFWWLSSEQLLVSLADGIGHGKLAYEASVRCLEAVEQYRKDCLIDIMQHCNQVLRKTRGVALALCKIDTQTKQLEFVGVGNIRSTVVGIKKTRLRSKMGILGDEARLQLCPQTVEFVAGQNMLCLSSDGVNEELPIQQYLRKSLYPNLEKVVEELLTNWGQASDDASILVVR